MIRFGYVIVGLLYLVMSIVYFQMVRYESAHDGGYVSQEVVKSDIHAFKVYQDDSRRGRFLGYNDDGSKIKAPVIVETMAGIIFDIDEGLTIEEFEALPISTL